MIDWLFTNALAALALAAIAGVLIWTFRPAPAVRHALWLVVVLKLVSPTGLVVSVPLPVDPPVAMKTETPTPKLEPLEESPVIEAEIFTVVVKPKPGQTLEEAAAAAIHMDAKPATLEESPAEAAVTPVETPRQPFDYRPYLLGLWATGAVFISWRQIRETLRFARFTRKSVPAGDSLIAEVAVVANRLGVRVPNVRVLPGLSSPVLWCLWRPILLWPAGLECRLKGDGRRAVLAHELAHLRRRDHWARRLEMIASVLHWWNPLFWVARKKLRADAELACDAWAAGQADRRAYAEALLEVCSFNPRRRPAPAVGVIGEGRRAMQERLTMIMRDRVPCRLAFGAKLVVALMAIAAVPAWTLGQSDPPAVPQPPEAAEPQVQAIEEQIRALSQKLEAMKAARRAEAERKVAEKRMMDAKIVLGDQLHDIHMRIDPTHGDKATAVKVLTAGEGGYKVIGPDGKEVKDVKIIVVDGKAHGGAATVTGPATLSLPSAPATAKVEGVRSVYQIVGDGATGKFTVANPGQNSYWTTTTASPTGNSITLSRATYKLGKDQATALATLLGAIKATVMETKVDGESITVTTTPDAQATIGSIVRLMQGQGGHFTYEWKVAPPATPATPRTPTPPAPPAAPKPPTTPAKPSANNATAGTVLELDFTNALELRDKVKPVEIELKLEAERLKADMLKAESLNADKLRLDKLKELEKLHEQLRLLLPAKPEAEKKPAGPGK